MIHYKRYIINIQFYSFFIYIKLVFYILWALTSGKDQSNIWPLELDALILLGLDMLLQVLLDQGWANCISTEGITDLDKVSKGPHIAQFN